MEATGGLPDPAQVLQRLQAAGCSWPAPVCVPVTESTNADAQVLVAEGVPHGTSVVAGQQTAGRGRHGRRWLSEPGAGLWCSVIFRAAAVKDPLSRLPLVSALAIVDTVRSIGGPSLDIKWPNDVLAADGRKLAGILVEASNDAAVVGIGINVDSSPTSLRESTCCLAVLGVSADRSELLAALLLALNDRMAKPWEENLANYRRSCKTLGSAIQVTLPGGEVLSGIGLDVDTEGHLLVKIGQTMQTVIAGDVVHATITP